ncbi:hypothetical protein RFI_35010, partial [Reticulomyxa filosa]
MHQKKKKKFDESIAHLQKYLQIAIDTFGVHHHHHHHHHHYIAIVYNSLGITLPMTAKDGQKSFVTYLYDNLGYTYEKKKKKQYDEALDSLKIRLEIFGSNHVDIVRSYNNLGSAYQSKKEYYKAISYYTKGIFGDNHEDIARSYANLGSNYEDKGDHNKALEYFEKALKIRLDLFGNNHADVARSYHSLGLCNEKAGKLDKAVEFYDKALKIRLDIFGACHDDVSESYTQITERDITSGALHQLVGHIHETKGELEAAWKCYEDAWN